MNATLLLSRNVAHEDFRDYLVGSHQAILDTLRNRDEPKTLAILDDHLRGSYERVVLGHARHDAPDGAVAASADGSQNTAPHHG